MKKRLLAYVACLVGCGLPAMSQAPRLSYHDSQFVLRHQLNPAFQPDSDYMAVNASFAVTSSLSMQDLLYERPNGSLTTFMGNHTVTKAELLDKVGGGMNNLGDIQVGLFSMGRRKDADRYQHLSVNFRANEMMRVERGLFDCLKDVSNGQYDLSGTRLSLLSWLEAAVGESRRLNSRWTVGARGKLLLGLYQTNLNIDRLLVDLEGDNWTAAGKMNALVSGMHYKTATEDYQAREGSFEKVKGASLSYPMLRGAGLAFDVGATYQLNPHWQLSASVLDAGFLMWFNSHHAENGDETFAFDGFHDASLAAESETSIDKQIHILEDGFADLTRLTPDDYHASAQLLRLTGHLAASCRYGDWHGGVLLTTRVQGNASWLESRVSVGWSPVTFLSFTLSPAYSTYGRFSVGAMATYNHPRGYQAYLGSDCFFWKMNKQLIPLSLNGALQLGLVLPF